MCASSRFRRRMPSKAAKLLNAGANDGLSLMAARKLLSTWASSLGTGPCVHRDRRIIVMGDVALRVKFHRLVRTTCAPHPSAPRETPEIPWFHAPKHSVDLPASTRSRSGRASATRSFVGQEIRTHRVGLRLRQGSRFECCVVHVGRKPSLEIGEASLPNVAFQVRLQLLEIAK